MHKKQKIAQAKVLYSATLGMLMQIRRCTKAIEFYEQALAIAREIGDRRARSCLGNLGIAYADLGDTHKAIEFYEQALVIAREIGDSRSEGDLISATWESLRRI